MVPPVILSERADLVTVLVRCVCELCRRDAFDRQRDGLRFLPVTFDKTLRPTLRRQSRTGVFNWVVNFPLEGSVGACSDFSARRDGLPQRPAGTEFFTLCAPGRSRSG